MKVKPLTGVCAPSRHRRLSCIASLRRKLRLILDIELNVHAISFTITLAQSHAYDILGHCETQSRIMILVEGI